MLEFAKTLLPAAIQRKIRRALCEYRRAGFARRLTQRRYGDFAPIIELVDQKGQQWYDRDQDFEPEILLLQHHGLVLGARVFDLGAHQGLVALALAHLVGELGSVIAVEAMPFDAGAAERNRKLNGVDHLIIINAAVAARRGTVEFTQSGCAAHGDDTLPTILVDAVTVDALSEKYGRPDILFIDVDGFEVEVLQGAKGVLRSRPPCYVEVHSPLLVQYGQSAEDVPGVFSVGRIRGACQPRDEGQPSSVRPAKSRNTRFGSGVSHGGPSEGSAMTSKTVANVRTLGTELTDDARLSCAATVMLGGVSPEEFEAAHKPRRKGVH